MSDINFQNPELHIRRQALPGGTSDMRLTLTINGDQVFQYQLDSYGELEDETGTLGIVFTTRDNEEPDTEKQESQP